MNERDQWSEPLRIIADHLVVERDGRLAILDTGVPTSMPCPEVVSEVLGVPVDRLIGCAELAEGPLEIDWPGRRLVHGAAPRADAVGIPLSRGAFGIPYIEIDTGGARVSAVLDTGAALSYVPPSVVEGLAPVRSATDFLPGFGSFTVDVHRLEVMVGGIPVVMNCGVLPPLLRMALALMCPDGWILGADLFRERVVRVDLAGSRLHLASGGVGRGGAGAGMGE